MQEERFSKDTKFCLELIEVLAAAGDAEAVAERLRLSSHENEAIRRRMLESRLRGGDRGVEVWRQALEDREDTRVMALELVPAFPDKQLVPLLAPHLRDRVQRLRGMAAKAIRCCGAEDAEPVLAQLTAEWDDPTELQCNVLNALSYPYSNPLIFDTVLKALPGLEVGAVLKVDKVLACYQDPARVVAEMTACLDDPSPRVRVVALWTLARLAQPGTADLFRRFLQAEVDHQRPAARGLFQVGDEADRARVKEIWLGLKQAGQPPGAPS